MVILKVTFVKNSDKNLTCLKIPWGRYEIEGLSRKLTTGVQPG
jgi:hypothetical protein